jgi:cytochrome c peroxidase
VRLPLAFLGCTLATLAGGCSDDPGADPAPQTGHGGTGGNSAAKNDNPAAYIPVVRDAGNTTPTSLGTGEAGPATIVKTGLEPSDPYPVVQFPVDNIYTQSKATLGKILFWEEQISSNNSVACGTCHRPGAGGSDPRASEPLSLGAGPNGIFGDADDVHGGRGIPRCSSTGTAKSDAVYANRAQVTTRRPPSNLDAMFFTSLFWDGRAGPEFADPLTQTVLLSKGGSLENQSMFSPLSDVEMTCEGASWQAVSAKLQTAIPLKLAKSLPADIVDAFATRKTYADLFDLSFGTPTVNPADIALAIATYERTLTSNQTPWDAFNGGDKTALTPAQQHGLSLFNTKAKCNQCHVPPLFTDDLYHNIGSTDPSLDPGRASITKDPADLGKMKTPSLRNVGLRLSGGLLHSGNAAGKTMGSLLASYNGGGAVKVHLDADIAPLQLSDDELTDLTDFIENGLTDSRAKGELPPFDRPRLSTE